MPGPASKTGRNRRRRAKITVDFATGEVHDRTMDVAMDPAARAGAIERAEGVTPPATAPTDALSPEELSNEDRAQLGVDRRRSARRARVANQQSRRRWVKER